MKKGKGIRLFLITAIVVLLLLALPLLGACGKATPAPTKTATPTTTASPSPTPSPTPTPTTPAKKVTYNIGVMLPLTGPAAEFGRIFQRSLTDLYNYYNDEIRAKGLPANVEIKLVTWDFVWDPTKAVTGVKKMIEEDKVIAISGWGSQTDPSTNPVQRQYGVPNVSLPPATIIWPPNVTFSIYYDYNDEAKGQLRWFVDQWKGAAKPKMAIVHEDTPFGRGLLKPVETYAKQIGVEIVETIAVPIPLTDATVEVTRIKKSGANFILARQVASNHAQLLKDMAKLDLKIPVVGGMQILNPAIERLAKAEANGLAYGPAALPDWFDEKDPQLGQVIKKLRDIFAKYHPGVKPEEDPLVWPSLNSYLSAWSYLAPELKALEIAVKDVGADKVDGPAMVKALEKVRDFDMFLPGMQPLRSYYPDDHRSIRQIRMAVFRDGQWVPASGWLNVPDKTDAEKKGEW